MKSMKDMNKESDARTNKPVDPLDWDVDSHMDYTRLREEFARMPKIPTLIHVDEAPVQEVPGRFYNWLLTSEQSGGSIAIHILNLEPGYSAGRHHHSNEEEFFFVLEGELEITVGSETRVGGPGTFAYVPPYSTHAFKVLDKACRVLHWNTPGGHERLASAMRRLEGQGGVSREDVQGTMEAHEYFLHNEQVYIDVAARLSGKR